MKLFVTAVVAAIALVSGTARAADDSALMTPVDGFLKATETGDIAAALKFCGPSQVMVDEFAPYHWSGPKAVRTWWAGFEKVSKAGGATDVTLTHGAPSRVEQDAHHAYVVLPTVIAMKIKGQPLKQDGVLTFALDRSAKGWKLAAVAWAGPSPTP